jgi:uncharacterized damage-inducible protein DinB
MDVSAHYLNLARNNAWSNHRIYKAVEKIGDAGLLTERPGFFKNLRFTLNHILIVDWYYISVLMRETDALRRYDEDEPCLSYADLLQAQRDSDEKYLSFCRTLTSNQMNDVTKLPRQNNVVHEETVKAILDHLNTHQIHHRGQVHTMILDAGVNPPQLDDFFLEQDRGEDISEIAALLPNY